MFNLLVFILGLTIGPIAASGVTVADIKAIESNEWSLLYKVDIPELKHDINTAADFKYAVDNSEAFKDMDTSKAYRVGYYLQLDDKHIWTSFDGTSVPVGQLGVPVDWLLQETREKLFVESNVDGVANINGDGTAGIEFWSSCYHAGADGYGTHDKAVGDNGDCYGSMQVHDENTDKVLWAWNGWSNPGYGDVGIGVSDVNPLYKDWTFAKNVDSYKVKQLSVFVTYVAPVKPQTPAPTYDERFCYVVGLSTHIMSFDGWRADNRAAGEFNMVKGDDLTIQVRQVRATHVNTTALLHYVSAVVMEGAWTCGFKFEAGFDYIPANTESPYKFFAQVTEPGKNTPVVFNLTTYSAGIAKLLEGNTCGIEFSGQSQRGLFFAMKDGEVWKSTVKYSLYQNKAAAGFLTQLAVNGDYMNAKNNMEGDKGICAGAEDKTNYPPLDCAESIFDVKPNNPENGCIVKTPSPTYDSRVCYVAGLATHLQSFDGWRGENKAAGEYNMVKNGDLTIQVRQMRVKNVNTTILHVAHAVVLDGPWMCGWKFEAGFNYDAALLPETPYKLFVRMTAPGETIPHVFDKDTYKSLFPKMLEGNKCGLELAEGALLGFNFKDGEVWKGTAKFGFFMNKNFAGFQNQMYMNSKYIDEKSEGICAGGEDKNNYPPLDCSDSIFDVKAALPENGCVAVAEQTPSPTYDADTCYIVGAATHILTFDDWRGEHRAAGEYLMLKNGNDLTMQVRQTRWEVGSAVIHTVQSVVMEGAWLCGLKFEAWFQRNMVVEAPFDMFIQVTEPGKATPTVFEEDTFKTGLPKLLEGYKCGIEYADKGLAFEFKDGEVWKGTAKFGYFKNANFAGFMNQLAVNPKYLDFDSGLEGICAGGKDAFKKWVPLDCSESLFDVKSGAFKAEEGCKPVVRNKPDVHCKSTGDPHFLYFDKSWGDYQFEGQFTMWDTKGLTVQTKQYKTHPTSAVAYNHAVAFSGAWTCGFVVEIDTIGPVGGTWWNGPRTQVASVVLPEYNNKPTFYTTIAKIHEGIRQLGLKQDCFDVTVSGSTLEIAFGAKAKLRIQMWHSGMNLWLDVRGLNHLETDKGYCPKGQFSKVACDKGNLFQMYDAKGCNGLPNGTPAPKTGCDPELKKQATAICNRCPDVVRIDECVTDACEEGSIKAAELLLDSCQINIPLTPECDLKADKNCILVNNRPTCKDGFVAAEKRKNPCIAVTTPKPTTTPKPVTPVTRNKPDVHCKSTGDPHFLLFNRRTLDYQFEGEFLMWKTEGLTIQTKQYKTRPTATVAYNYAVVFGGAWTCGLNIEINTVTPVGDVWKGQQGAEVAYITDNNGSGKQMFSTIDGIHAGMAKLSEQCHQRVGQGLCAENSCFDVSVRGGVMEFAFGARAKLRVQMWTWGMNFWLDVRGLNYLDTDTGYCTDKTGSFERVSCDQSLFSMYDKRGCGGQTYGTPAPETPCDPTLKKAAEAICDKCPGVVLPSECVTDACQEGSLDAAKRLLESCRINIPINPECPEKTDPNCVIVNDRPTCRNGFVAAEKATDPCIPVVTPKPVQDPTPHPVVVRTKPDVHCVTHGDPHFLLFSGTRMDYQFEGEFTMWKTGGLTVHSRQYKLTPTASVAYNHAVAFEGEWTCGHTVEINTITPAGGDLWKGAATQVARVTDAQGNTVFYSPNSGLMKGLVDHGFGCFDVAVRGVTIEFQFGAKAKLRVQLGSRAMNIWLDVRGKDYLESDTGYCTQSRGPFAKVPCDRSLFEMYGPNGCDGRPDGTPAPKGKCDPKVKAAAEKICSLCPKTVAPADCVTDACAENSVSAAEELLKACVLPTPINHECPVGDENCVEINKRRTCKKGFVAGEKSTERCVPVATPRPVAAPTAKPIKPIVVTRNIPDVHCYSTGDPHFLLFDGTRMDYQFEGEFTMWKTEGLNIQTKQYKRSPTASVAYNHAVVLEGDWTCGYKIEIDAKIGGTQKAQITKNGVPTQTFTTIANIQNGLAGFSQPCFDVTVNGGVVEFAFGAKARLRVQMWSSGMHLWLDVRGLNYLETDSGYCTKSGGPFEQPDCQDSLFDMYDNKLGCGGRPTGTPGPSKECNPTVRAAAEKMCSRCPKVVKPDECVLDACAENSVEAAELILKACDIGTKITPECSASDPNCEKGFCKKGFVAAEKKTDPCIAVVTPKPSAEGTPPPTVPLLPKADVKCQSTGDPHMVAFDGKRFDFQNVGEFTMWKTKGLAVQTRQRRTSPGSSVSYNRAVVLAGDWMCGVKVEINGYAPLGDTLPGVTSRQIAQITIGGNKMPIVQGTAQIHQQLVALAAGVSCFDVTSNGHTLEFSFGAKAKVRMAIFNGGLHLYIDVRGMNYLQSDTGYCTNNEGKKEALTCAKSNFDIYDAAGCDGAPVKKIKEKDILGECDKTFLAKAKEICSLCPHVVTDKECLIEACALKSLDKAQSYMLEACGLDKKLTHECPESDNNCALVDGRRTCQAPFVPAESNLDKCVEKPECGFRGRLVSKGAKKLSRKVKKITKSKMTKTACICALACEQVGGTEFEWQTKSKKGKVSKKGGACRCYTGSSKMYINKGAHIVGIISGTNVEVINGK